MKKVWSFFSSIYLTVVLAVLICGVSAWGSTISMNNPRFSMALDQSVLFPFLLSLGTSYLNLALWVWALIALTALFALNTAVCTADKVYSVVKAKRPVTALFPHIVHIGFLIALIGHLAGSVWGFRSYDNVIFKGEVKPVPGQAGLYVRLDGIDMKVTPQGELDSLKTRITLFGEDKKEVLADDIQINGPVIYRGVAFYHTDQGETPSGLILDVGGQTVKTDFEGAFKAADGSSFRLETIYPDFAVENGRPISRSGEFLNPHVEVISENGEVGYLSLKEPGSVVKTAGKTIRLLDYDISAYAVLMINKDPGIGFIIAGSSVLVTGMLLLLFFRGDRSELVNKRAA